MKHICISFLLLTFSVFAAGQSTTATATPNDPSSLKLVQTSYAAMGGTLPSDSVTTGVAVVTAGGETQTGTYRHLTRATDQTAEHIVLPDGDRQRIYSRGLGVQKIDTTVEANSDEWAATGESAGLPIILLGQALQDPATTVTDAGTAVVDGGSSHCVTLGKTYADSNKQSLAAVSNRTVCFDSTTSLPKSVSHISRTAQGAVAGVAVEVHFSDYRNVNGILVPYSIHQYVNGTPWAAISIQSVTFNSGLTDADFATE